MIVQKATTTTPNKESTGQKVKDKAFFALVLLPLSCYYTRGGSKLMDVDEEGLEAPRRSLQGVRTEGGENENGGRRRSLQGVRWSSEVAEIPNGMQLARASPVEVEKRLRG
jgi:hypothetical protein